jgi:hypothetical protein
MPASFLFAGPQCCGLSAGIRYAPGHPLANSFIFGTVLPRQQPVETQSDLLSLSTNLAVLDNLAGRQVAL